MTKILISTPMYGGVCNGVFAKSLIALMQKLNQNGYEVLFQDLYNESLITRARNTLTEAFLRSDATHLLFIDADQGFSADGIIQMIKEDKGVIGAAVPMKGINWERVKKAALAGEETLDVHTGIYNLNIINPSDIDKLRENPNDVIPVHNIGTGLMLIKREVLEDMKQDIDSYAYNQPAVYGINPGDRVHNFWNLSIENDLLLSEDYNFCRIWREKGNEVYLAPYVKVIHAGSYWFK